MATAQQLSSTTWRLVRDSGEVFDFSDKEGATHTIETLEAAYQQVHYPPEDPALNALLLRENIRREADRRIQIAIGARTAAHADEALRTAALTSSAILSKKVAGIPLTPEEQFAEDMYAFMFGYIRAVKATQNQLEAELNEDYTNDARWPAPVSP